MRFRSATVNSFHCLFIFPSLSFFPPGLTAPGMPKRQLLRYKTHESCQCAAKKNKKHCKSFARQVLSSFFLFFISAVNFLHLIYQLPFWQSFYQKHAILAVVPRGTFSKITKQ